MTTPTQTPVTYVYVNQPPRQSGLSTAALVLGLLTFLTFGATGVPALICGIVALRDAKVNRNPNTGAAVTGLILGSLTVAGWCGIWALYFIGAATRY